MNILLRGNRLLRLLPWRNQSLILPAPLGAVNDRPQPHVSANRPANDSDAALLGDIARKASADRSRRAEIVGTTELFGEPAWDILLQLFIAACEGRRLSIAAACSGAGVPESTALRWIAILESRDVVVREGDPRDPVIRLNASTYGSLADYFRRC